ncbi:MAG: pyridoxal phosphate-dependent aminotransferase [Dehalococcoidia bacterium]|nr:pyridoxal phosphate-dependent aminotransferase [Dehalococcoidia bacterium]
MKTTPRVGGLPTEPAIETFLKAQQLQSKGVDVVHLEIGEPDFETPAHIREAAKESLDRGQTHYCDSQGILELREAIAERVSQVRHVNVDPNCVAVTPGLRPVLFYGALLTLDVGDEGIYLDPAFAAFPSVIRFAGAKAVPVPLRGRNGFRLDLDELESAITPRTRLLTLNSPHNPTGGVLTDAELRAIARLAEEHDLFVLSDETYEEIFYDERPHSVLEYPELRQRSIVLSGFSKTYCMTGWRLGYAILPPALVDPFVRLTANSVTCSTTFVQHAAVRALRGSQESVRTMVEEFRGRRDILVQRLNGMRGIHCHTPSGAFYAFPDVSGLGISDVEFARRLLDDAGGDTLAGSVFGEQGRGYLRLAYTTSRAGILKALDRMDRVVADVSAARAAS